jgi:hypothetical protein
LQQGDQGRALRTELDAGINRFGHWRHAERKFLALTYSDAVLAI